ncbi:L domain-like protein [Neocallimastix lanati (nom. inval.)]|uniref:L domain-like protein n=1 Tax=Neocallimastix californiae TaxID=1754190 RepID=A0A1Y2ADZ4_9FUNG|nr:L domain-like protein [Neocallimastix sp. JGI-2020a]ORY20773.1 L domain-like protein [Neocallimastix californiae]|eukprot:ORY20773.1 L domain-like protein [Neocallimastix californiae]
MTITTLITNTKSTLTFMDVRNAKMPSSVGSSMPMLTKLYLNECKIEGSIPEDIGNLLNLEDLQISDNNLTGPIPDSIGKLSKLKTLILSKNQLSGPIPSTIGGLSDITMLNLSYNQLSGTIPDTISGMTSLMGFNLRNNFNLKGKAPATKNLKYINSDCNYQNTSVCFTEEDKDKRCTYPGGGYVCSTCKENATLGDDGICQCNTGYLGTGYIDCYNDCKFANSLLGKEETNDCCSYDVTKIKCNSSNRVTEISLSGCNLEGSIPSDIGNLVELRELALDNNKLTGAIPDISGLTKLTTLALNNNELEGAIPINIATDLTKLILNNNKLTGTIPAEIGKLTKLQTINLGSNQLEGEIPENILTISSSLHELSLNDNKLSGSIPENIGSLINLRILNLGGNGLTGTIPSSINSLNNYLELLNIEKNQLYGDISAISNLNNLQHLNLSNNKFNGTIPNTIGNLNKLKSLLLSDNEFSDLIPTQELEKMTLLSEINLSNNKELYGQIINTKNLNELTQCNFDGTNLCNSKDKADTRCTYSKENYDCTACKKDATIGANGMCQCNENYTGIGYIDCTRIPGTEEETKNGEITNPDLNNNSAFDAFSPRNIKYIFKFVNVALTIMVMGMLFM